MSSIDWKNLGFQYIQTDHFIKVEYTNGKWGALELCTEPYIRLHIAATCLHYGQACFEGQKAFSRRDGSVAIFRPEENAQRLIDTAERLVMVPPSIELFVETARQVIRANKKFIPPFNTGASLYLRPFLIGSSPHVGVHPSEDYTFLMLVTPVGPYYKEGFFPVRALVQERYDRAAPHGVGNVKASGNYAAGMMGDLEGMSKGFPISLYLDSTCHKYIDEFGTSNFIGITKDNKYVTPDSTSILPSITNKSLQTIAADFGLTVERRKIEIGELPEFVEVGACGTAAVITPVYSITYGDKVFTFGKPDVAGEIITKLYKEIQGIQYGEISDRHRWMLDVGKI